MKRISVNELATSTGKSISTIRTRLGNDGVQPVGYEKRGRRTVYVYDERELLASVNKALPRGRPHL